MKKILFILFLLTSLISKGQYWDILTNEFVFKKTDLSGNVVDVRKKFLVAADVNLSSYLQSSDTTGRWLQDWKISNDSMFLKKNGTFYFVGKFPSGSTLVGRLDTIHYSSFIASNGTAITAYTPVVGAAWTNIDGSWEIQSNAAVPLTYGTGGNTATMLNNLGKADYKLKLNISTTGSVYGYPVIWPRYTDANNFIQILLYGGSTLKVYDIVAGVSAETASVSVAYGTSAHDYVISLKANKINITYDGTPVISDLTTAVTTGNKLALLQGGSNAPQVSYHDVLVVDSVFTSSSALAGNSGNVLINRNGVINTPGGDSAKWNNGLEIKGNVNVKDDAYNATSWDSNNDVPTKNAIRDKIEALPSGTGDAYTPTLYATANVSGLSASGIRYTVNGNVLTISGTISFTTTAATTASQIGFDVPSGICGTISSAESVAGVVGFKSSIGNTAWVEGDVSNTRPTIKFTSGASTGTGKLTFTCTLIINNC